MRASDVTVVGLTFNRDRYVAEALAGLRAQSHRGWNLLLSDASTDPGKRDGVARSFDAHAERDGACRSLFIACTPGLSQAEHLEAVLRRVSTSFVAFLDDDDVWMPDHLATGLRWLGEDERRGVFVGNSIVIDEGGSASGIRHLAARRLPGEAETGRCLDYILRYAFSSTSGIVMRTAALRSHRFIVTSCVDVHLCVSALLGGYRVGLHPRPTFYYRVHAGSAYGQGPQAYADRHRLRLRLAARHGPAITRRVPHFPLLALKSAVFCAGRALRGGRRGRSPEHPREPAMIAR